jgi:hypothetical protein
LSEKDDGKGKVQGVVGLLSPPGRR